MVEQELKGYEKMVSKITWNHLSKNPSHNFTELYSVGMTGAWKGISSYNSEKQTKKSTWIYISINGEIRDYLKQCRNPYPTEDVDVDVDWMYGSTDKISLIQIDIQSILNEADGEFIRERFYEDKKLSDVGRSFGFSESRAKQRETEITNKLKKALEA